MLNSTRIVLPIAAAALFVVSMAPSIESEAATESDKAPSVTLQYRSTDLGTSQGVAGLYQRIRLAAQSVCGPFDGRLLEEKLRWQACVDHAIASAVASVHSESLSAYYGRQMRGWKRPRTEAPTLLAAH
jgi:UrcA family protein